MFLTLAEISDKIGTGFEPAIGGVIVASVLLWLSRFRVWLYGLVIPVAYWGNWNIAAEMNDPFGALIINEVGIGFFVRSFASWNAPLVLGLPLAFVIRTRHVRVVRQSMECCPTCGYDTRAGHDRCPECGTRPALRRRPDRRNDVCP